MITPKQRANYDSVCGPARRATRITPPTGPSFIAEASGQPYRNTPGYHVEDVTGWAFATGFLVDE